MRRPSCCFIRRRILLGGGTAIAGATSAMDTTATSRKPNILVISVDDLGFNLVGFRANAANNSDVVTPSIDQLAGEGIVMDRFYATPWCAPSRGALQTGRSMGTEECLELGSQRPLRGPGRRKQDEA